MPLEWDEVQMKGFTILNTIECLESLGDIFKPVLGKGIDMKNIFLSFQTVPPFIGVSRNRE